MNKIAIVTGANKGLGFAVVQGLCAKYDGLVYLTARDKTRGTEAVKRLKKYQNKLRFYQLDVSDKTNVKHFGIFLKSKHGRIDVLVNNAAILEWDQIYPTYEAAKRNINTNYKSLLHVEKYLFNSLTDDARVINVSSACGHLSNLRRKSWIEMFKSSNLTVEQINNFVEEYLESVKNGTFDKNDFADDGKHAEHRVSKIGVTALTFVLQKKYPCISINAVHPGHIKTDMSQGGGEVSPNEAAKLILYLIFEASSNLKGSLLWCDKKLVDWYDAEGNYYCSGLW